jgi:hypothetical protein
MNPKKLSIGKIHEGNIRLRHNTAGWLRQAYELKRAEELIYLLDIGEAHDG